MTNGPDGSCADNGPDESSAANDPAETVGGNVQTADADVHIIDAVLTLQS